MGDVDYAAIRAVNASTLKHMARSPLHFKHARESSGVSTPSTFLGTACHAAILEPEKFARDFVVYDGDRRGKAYTACVEAHPGKTILKPAEHAKCCAMRDAVRSHPKAAPLLAEGEREVVLQWTDEETGLPCKGRLDFLSALAIVDLKTSIDVEPFAFGRTAARYRMPLQFAFYRAGVKAARGLDLPVRIIAVESAPPHDVAVYTVSDDDLWVGECEVRRLMAKVAECELRGEWPGQVPDESPLILPTWAFDGADDDGAYSDEPEVEAA